ncbi:MAG: 2-C-methyl-D-erythritol 2,4-cyclodiphosphate synthase [Actinomycetota bacterium]|nr:2-C-methyl-D-erythritol 2,4-cyclodiphosphate synthase [Actinomycetota bacterium]
MTGAGTVPLRIGQGVDFHRFSDDPSRPLVLGGITVDGDGVRGLDGHSDADALAHALADAVLGAAQLGDLGVHFPSSDPVWAGADSMDLLARTLVLAAAAGWVPVNADCTVVAQVPRLAHATGQMADRLTEVTGAPVSVKATTTDGLGAIGRAEGVGALAVVLLTAGPARGSA